MNSTTVAEISGERLAARDSARDRSVEASKIFGYALVPLGLLSTNITGLAIPETMPLVLWRWAVRMFGSGGR